ncbi:MAG: patatin, partial [Psychromonas sp.]|nr:patatin [Psychromonas sp.]
VITDGEVNMHLSELGGFLNLSGYQKDALVGDHKAFTAVVYQYDLAGVSHGVGLPIYLGGSLEAGNVWSLNEDVDIGNVVTSGSLFLGTDTTFGPAIIGLGYATSFGYYDENPLTLFFSLGKTW